MRILMVASEAFPLIKTGGLADVTGALSKALATLGNDVRLMLPGYPAVLERVVWEGEPYAVSDPHGLGPASIMPARLPDSDLHLLIVRSPPSFERDGGPYLDLTGRDWPDNWRRFALLSWAAAWVSAEGDPFGWRPDILHAHDWQTGLAPAYLALDDGTRPSTVFTIHNIQYQGLFGPEVVRPIGLPDHVFHMDQMEFYGHLSYLKAGIRYSDRVTTVSPRYAEETLGPEAGWGMDGLLRWRGGTYLGILNGVDTEIWDPATDAALPATYDAASLERRGVNKSMVQRAMGLHEDPGAFLLVAVSRLTEQKGSDVLLSSVPGLVAMGAQLAVLGSGEAWLENGFGSQAMNHPGRVAFFRGYDETLAHRLFGAGDAFLMPSRAEPCGLTQMYALRYGCPPIVRWTGGLADTVTDASRPDGTGFIFGFPSADDILAAARRARDLYQDGAAWRAMQRRGMARDFGWERSAQAYKALYDTLV